MSQNPTPTYKQQHIYYNQLWSKWFNPTFVGGDDCRLEFIKSSIKKLRAEYGRPLKIIDLGCGRGWISNAISKYGDVIGVDLSPQAAKKLYPNLNFIEANIVTDDIPGLYDIVISSEVIEHLVTEDQITYVRKAAALLNDNGYLILTTPNRPATEVLFKEVPRAAKHRQPIENWLDEDTLHKLLKPWFKVGQSTSIIFCPMWIRKSRLLNALYFLLYARFRLFTLIDKNRPSKQQGLHLAIVAQKNPAS